jgi:hypothetical protein
MTLADDGRAARDKRGQTLPPPRDPDLAVREEYNLARGNRAGLELFLARHPDHPLAAEARKELDRLTR